MKHPTSRSERRAARATYMAYRRRIIKQVWHRFADFQPEDNGWWQRCAKHNGAHGCRMCKYEKYDRSSVRKRRRALQQDVLDNLQSWDE